MDRVWLVTGASRGIGASTALLAARQGWAVVVNYSVRGDEAQNVVDRIRAEGGRAMALQADVYDEAQVLHVFEQIDRQWSMWPRVWTKGAGRAGDACLMWMYWVGCFVPARQSRG